MRSRKGAAARKLGFVAIYIRWRLFIGLPIVPTKIGPCLGPVLWAGVAAQALLTYRARPALSTINRA
jgi:glyoxylate carboligase